MPRGISTQVLGGFKTGMDRQTKRGGKDGAQRLYTLENAYLNERGDAVPRPGLQHVANVAHSAGLYGWQGQLHVFHGESDFVDPGNPLVAAHWIRYPLAPPPDLTITGTFAPVYLGQPYSSDLTISGSVAPYSNPRVTVGTLPAGLSLSLVGNLLWLSGTPTGTASTVNVTVAVDSTDQTTATSAQVLSLIQVTFATTWDPMTTPALGVLTNGNATYGSSSASPIYTVFGRYRLAGKSYFEYQIASVSTLNAYARAGIATSIFDRTLNLLGLIPVGGGGGYSIAEVAVPTGVVAQGTNVGNVDAAARTTSMRVRVAVDVTTRKVWIGAVGSVGWVGGGDPATGTTPTYTVPGTDPLWPAASLDSNPQTITIVSLASDLLGSAPAGFTAGLSTTTIPGATVFDSLVSNPVNTLSNGNLTVTSTGTDLNQCTSLSTNIKTSGKPYWEVTALSAVNNQPRAAWGISSEGGDLNRYHTERMVRSVFLRSDGSKTVNSVTPVAGITAGINTGDVLRFRFDIGTGTFEVALNAGSWITLATGLSAAGWRAAISMYYGGFTAEGGTFNFGASAFSYAVPAGYDAGWLP